MRKSYLFILLAGLAGLLTFSSCSPSVQMLNRIPVFKVHVKAVDTNGAPVPGAVVESSNGRETSTDSTGMADISFGSVGVHAITVMADNRAPANLAITMPADRGKTVEARLGDPVTYNYSGISFGASMSQFYPMMFSWMFSSYGYNMDLTSYEPGQWTDWSIKTGDGDETLHFRKAFLKELENGQQWWQIQYKNEDGDSGDQYIVEVLFSEDRQSIRRIREKIGDEEPRERPVTENWYTSPQKLTKESVEGAVTEEGVSVDVPAGAFTADLLDFGVAPGMDLKIWRSGEVPGSVVKYSNVNQEEDEVLYSSRLVDYGDDAKTLLDSF